MINIDTTNMCSHLQKKLFALQSKGLATLSRERPRISCGSGGSPYLRPENTTTRMKGSRNAACFLCKKRNHILL